MPWPFVVIGESVAIMAYRSHCLFEIDEPVRTALYCCSVFGAHGLRRLTSTENRIERVLRQDVLNVREEQFLMLLFVMDAEDENRLNFTKHTVVSI